MGRHFAACAAAILVASLLLSVATAEDAPVDVCPANSVHKTLPFLKTIKPGALGALLTNGMSIDMTAVTEFAKTTLIPVIGANVFFFALAALLLLIFVPWRLLRWCCVVCCCRGGCDLRRSKHDPGELLFGKRMKINKGFMYLFGLVAVAFAVYGLATVDKNITDGAFNVLTTISDYANGAFDTLDNVINTIEGTTDIIDDFQAIITIDVEVDNVLTNLTAIGTFLDTSPTPSSLLTKMDALTTAVNPGTTGALSTLSTGITTFTTNTDAAVGPPARTWRARHTIIETANTRLTQASAPKGMAVLSSDLNAAFAPAAPPSNADANALKAAAQAVYDSTFASDWVQQLDDLKDALINGVGAGNPFTVLKGQVQAVINAANDVTTVKLPALTAAINGFADGYDAVAPKMAGLLVKLQYINSTIMELPTSMQDAYTKLADAKQQMDAAMQTSPRQLAADLTTFATTGMPDFTVLSNLVTSLTSAESALQKSTAPTMYPLADTQTYLDWIAVTRAAVLAMQGANLASGPLKSFLDAVTAYVNGGYIANYVTTMGTQHDALKTAIAAVVDPTAFGVVPAVVADYSTKAGGTKTGPSGGPFDTAGAGSYVTSAQIALTNNLPSTATLRPQLVAADASYSALGATPSAIVSGPTTQLTNIKDAAITSGNNVKSQIQNTVGAFKGSTGNMRDMVVTQVTDIKAKYQEPAKTYDGYRYTASMALYGISILFVGLVIAASLANYHFGTNLSTLLLLFITILYFLLALIIALLIAALYMGCNEMEPLAVRLAPAQFTPLLRYYFYNEGASVEAVLKDANLVDITQIKGTVQDSKGQVVQGLTGDFKWKNDNTNPRNPYVLIERINTTIDTTLGYVDDLLAKAGREELFKVYSEVKGYICCSVPDLVTPMWTGLTMAGVFAVALIICTFFYISKIDHAPRKDCCGCTCHTRSKYAGSVHPNGEALPQFATPGWEQTPGYEAPNGAMAMHVPWIAGPEHGMVNVVVAGPGGVPKAKGM